MGPVHTVAFADDQLLVMAGNSLQEVEQNWERVCKECLKWSARLKIGVQTIKLKDLMTYQGVMLDSRGTFLSHVRGLRDRVYRTLVKLVRMGEERVGIERKKFIREI